MNLKKQNLSSLAKNLKTRILGKNQVQKLKKLNGSGDLEKPPKKTYLSFFKSKKKQRLSCYTNPKLTFLISTWIIMLESDGFKLPPTKKTWIHK